MMFSKLLMIGAIVCQTASSPTSTEAQIFTEDQIAIHEIAKEVCENYDNVDPELIIAVVQKESVYDPEASNGNCVGLMQVSLKYHKDRAEELGVTDFYDEYSNILLGTDYISELLYEYEDINLVLMLYNMKWDSAFSLYKQGKVSSYAKDVLSKAETIAAYTDTQLYGQEVIFNAEKSIVNLQ